MVQYNYKVDILPLRLIVGIDFPLCVIASCHAAAPHVRSFVHLFVWSIYSWDGLEPTVDPLRRLLHGFPRSLLVIVSRGGHGRFSHTYHESAAAATQVR